MALKRDAKRGPRIGTNQGLATEYTPLDTWLKDAGYSSERFANDTGLSTNTVTRLRRGVCLPSLITAFTIERYTRGEVPATCWLGTMLAKLEWNNLLKRRRV